MNASDIILPGEYVVSWVWNIKNRHQLHSPRILFLDTVWLLSRDQYLDAKEEAIFFGKTNEVLRSNKIDPAVIQKSEQANCAVEKSDKDKNQA